MRHVVRIASLVLIAASVLAVDACDANSREMAGSYRLRRLVTRPSVTPSDTSYDLWDTARPENEAGWSGAVVRIGWDAHNIVVLRASPSSPYGFAAGWMLIDVDGGGRSGPLIAEQLRQRPDAAHLVTYRADSAWGKLNGH